MPSISDAPIPKVLSKKELTYRHAFLAQCVEYGGKGRLANQTSSVDSLTSLQALNCEEEHFQSRCDQSSLCTLQLHTTLKNES